ncbi:uncharacterized protein LOC142920146 [Petromyzon marinus]|uniref:uncharacterized protein LOC142920146 n=1 Tax=Petromyzon marinus TaxID=7757 RepID=UPI003F70ACB3
MADGDLIFISQPHGSALCRLLNQQRLRDQSCDLRIVVGDEVFLVHAGVLRAASPFLMRALAPCAAAGASYELHVPGLSAAAFEDFLTLLYTGHLRAPPARFRAAMGYARRLEVRFVTDSEDDDDDDDGGPREPAVLRPCGNRSDDGRAPATAAAPGASGARGRRRDGRICRASVAEQARLRQERYDRRNAVGLAGGRAEPPAEPPLKKGAGASATGRRHRRRALPDAASVEQRRPDESDVFAGDGGGNDDAAAEGCVGATVPRDGGGAGRRGHAAGPGGCDFARGDAGGGSGGGLDAGRAGRGRGGGGFDWGGVDWDCTSGGVDDDVEIAAAAAADLVAGDAGGTLVGEAAAAVASVVD